MPYVMVPVPEEFEKEVQTEVFNMILRRASEGWTPESARALLAAGTGWDRFFTLLLQDAMVKRVSGPSEIAAALGIDEGEVLARHEAIVEYAKARQLPLPVWTTPPHVPGLDRTITSMFLPADLARVLEAELSGGPSSEP